jgi:hypothetical protein
MAFPTIATTNNGNDTSGTSHTVNLPASIASGDLLIAIFASDGSTAHTWPSGWDQAANNLIGTTTSTDVTLSAKQRVADGSEGSTITVTTGASEWTAHITLRITGWHGTTAAEAGTATGSSATANPPSLNPTNWDVEDTLWVACACNDTGGTDNDDITAHPSSYTGIQIVTAGTNAGGVCLAASQRNNATAAEDPGTYTAPTTEAWVAGTIGVRPAAAATPTIPFLVMAPIGAAA